MELDKILDDLHVIIDQDKKVEEFEKIINEATKASYSTKSFFKKLYSSHKQNIPIVDKIIVGKVDYFSAIFNNRALVDNTDNKDILKFFIEKVIKSKNVLIYTCENSSNLFKELLQSSIMDKLSDKEKLKIFQDTEIIPNKSLFTEIISHECIENFIISKPIKEEGALYKIYSTPNSKKTGTLFDLLMKNKVDNKIFKFVLDNLSLSSNKSFEILNQYDEGKHFAMYKIFKLYDKKYYDTLFNSDIWKLFTIEQKEALISLAENNKTTLLWNILKNKKYNSIEIKDDGFLCSSFLKFLEDDYLFEQTISSSSIRKSMNSENLVQIAKVTQCTSKIDNNKNSVLSHLISYGELSREKIIALQNEDFALSNCDINKNKCIDIRERGVIYYSDGAGHASKNLLVITGEQKNRDLISGFEIPFYNMGWNVTVMHASFNKGTNKKNYTKIYDNAKFDAIVVLAHGIREKVNYKYINDLSINLFFQSSISGEQFLNDLIKNTTDNRPVKIFITSCFGKWIFSNLNVIKKLPENSNIITLAQKYPSDLINYEDDKFNDSSQAKKDLEDSLINDYNATKLDDVHNLINTISHRYKSTGKVVDLAYFDFQIIIDYVLGSSYNQKGRGIPTIATVEKLDGLEYYLSFIPFFSKSKVIIYNFTPIDETHINHNKYKNVICNKNKICIEHYNKCTTDDRCLSTDISFLQKPHDYSEEKDDLLLGISLSIRLCYSMYDKVQHLYVDEEKEMHVDKCDAFENLVDPSLWVCNW